MLKRDALYVEAYFELKVHQKEKKINEEIERLNNDVQRNDLPQYHTSYYLIWYNVYLMLRAMYSGGYSLKEMKEHVPVLIQNFEQYEYFKKKDNYDELYLNKLSDYYKVLSVLSLAYLLNIDKMYIQLFANALQRDGEDLLLEEVFVRCGISNRKSGKKLLHPKVYAPLYDALIAQDNTAKTSRMIDFLKQWYKGFRSASWYGSHEEGPGSWETFDYYGYWAFEASLVVCLNNIDDSELGTMPFYPKDLAAYAKSWL